MKTAKDIIDLWPSRHDLAEDVSSSKAAVDHWASRGAIPAVHDAALLRGAAARDIPLTWEQVVAHRETQKGAA